MADLPTVNSTYTRLYNSQQDKFEIFQVRIVIKDFNGGSLKMPTKAQNSFPLF